MVCQSCCEIGLDSKSTFLMIAAKGGNFPDVRNVYQIELLENEQAVKDQGEQFRLPAMSYNIFIRRTIFSTVV